MTRFFIERFRHTGLMRRLLVVLFMGTLGFGAGAHFNVHAFTRPSGSASSYSARRQAIESQARQGEHDIVVLGDSIVEFAGVDGLCGSRVLNAGIAGARVEDVLDFAPSVMQAVPAKSVIVAVGINDAARRFKTDVASFSTSYRALIQYLTAMGVSVRVATIAPVGSNVAATESPYDVEYSKELSSHILALAADFSLPVIDLAGLPKTPFGALRAELTTDGVHLSPLGYLAWLGKLEDSLCGEHARAPK
jgi:lysophospholipase L1-like esterase